MRKSSVQGNGLAGLGGLGEDGTLGRISELWGVSGPRDVFCLRQAGGLLDKPTKVVLFLALKTC